MLETPRYDIRAREAKKYVRSRAELQQAFPVGGVSMMGNGARELVDELLDAIECHDYERARGLLADEGFRYESPLWKFSSADDFVQHFSLMGGILHKIERLKVFVDEQELCHILVFVTQLSDKESIKSVLWTRVADGRIQRIEALFDTHWYRRLFESDA
jgi:hypothetical protein